MRYYKIQCITILLLLLYSVVYSQDETTRDTLMSQTLKGSFTISGEVIFYYNDYNQILYLTPSGGYFIIDNLLLGLSVSYNLTSDDRHTYWNLAIGPTFEYYFGNSASKPFAGVNIQNNSSKYSSRSTITYQLKVGYHIAIAKNLALQPVLQLFGSNGDFGSLLMFGMGIKGFIF